MKHFNIEKSYISVSNKYSIIYPEPHRQFFNCPCLFLCKHFTLQTYADLLDYYGFMIGAHSRIHEDPKEINGNKRESSIKSDRAMVSNPFFSVLPPWTSAILFSAHFAAPLFYDRAYYR